MKYQTPQFIEEEDKLFGPLSFRQFVYIVGGVGISLLIYRSLPILIAIVVIIPVAVLSLALAFYKVNERPFIETLEAAFFFIFSKRLYTYKKINKAIKPEENKPTNTPATMPVPKISDSKLKDLAWSLDINEKINK